MPYIYVPAPDYDRTIAARGALRPRLFTPSEPVPDYPVTIKMTPQQVKALRMDDYIDKQFEEIKEEDELEEEIPHISILERIEAIEGRLEEARPISNRTKDYIRHMGVPVLPPIISEEPDHDMREPLELKGVSLEDNRAFLHHLANHRNYDTLKSMRSCGDCPICKTVFAKHMESLQEEEDGGSSSHSSQRAQPTPPRQGSHGRRGDVRDLFH